MISADIQARFNRRPLGRLARRRRVVRARGLAKRLDNAPLAIVDKRRERAGKSEVMNIIGDVEGTCILVDDIVDSAGTLCNAAARAQGSRARPRCSLIAAMACCRAGGGAGGHVAS